MTASLFVQGLINGLNQGAIYALIALGYTMVYGIIRMINFAHGDFIMIGAYTLFYTIPLGNAGVGRAVHQRCHRRQTGADTGHEHLFGKPGHGVLGESKKLYSAED